MYYAAANVGALYLGLFRLKAFGWGLINLPSVSDQVWLSSGPWSGLVFLNFLAELLCLLLGSLIYDSIS